MDRRRFIQIAGCSAILGSIGVGSATASSGTLTNAKETTSGSIVATDDNFVIAGQDLTVDDNFDSPVIDNDGYSGEIYDNTLTITDIDGTTFGILVDGGDVDVYDNTVDAVDDLTHQFLAIGFTDGATGEASGNEIAGKHRVGVYVNGSGTDVNISRNTIVGPGPTTTGWADNGIQVSGDATGTIKDNTVDEHWWSPNTFVSAGILTYGTDRVNLHHNSLENNDMGIAILGERNKALHNDVEVTYDDTDTEHYGVVEYDGVNNAINQNSITAAGDDDALYGIIAGGRNTKLIGNELSGWQEAIAAAGEDTKLPKPFEPDS